MADDLVRQGKISREQANAELAGSGPDGVDAHLASIDYVPAKPEEYSMPKITEDGAYTPEVAAWDKQRRQWLSTAKLDKAIGSELARNAEETHQRLKGMTDGQRELWAAGQRAQLDRLGFTQERINLARQLVAEVEASSPGLVAYLFDTGAGNDARIVANVVLQAERLNSRPVKK